VPRKRKDDQKELPLCKHVELYFGEEGSRPRMYCRDETAFPLDFCTFPSSLTYIFPTSGTLRAKRNILCEGFLSISPLTIPLHHALLCQPQRVICTFEMVTHSSRDPEEQRLAAEAMQHLAFRLLESLEQQTQDEARRRRLESNIVHQAHKAHRRRLRHQAQQQQQHVRDEQQE
jgi:hypothetical protein